MENKKNRKVKIFLFGVFILGVCNFVGLEQGIAQDKKETHITIKKGLNDDFIILSGNGPDVRIAECAEKVCVQMSYWCDPGSVGYIHDVNSDVCGNGGRGKHHKTAYLDYNSNCQARVRTKTSYKTGEGCYDLYSIVGSPSYKRSGCSKYRCIAWKAPADKVLSLMPLIGQSMIDVNLIEY